ncbi:MAG: hypothetical protein P1U32_09065 [Legionellaceae bacterium]|nr:hypothetical protein [Legionellaceae bacterium]
MPYIKVVKDTEGGVAEAVSVELAHLAEISHPSQDTPEVIVTPKSDSPPDTPRKESDTSDTLSVNSDTSSEHSVTLPRYTMNQSLSDVMFSIALEGEEPTLFTDEKFLNSLGRSLAFNWYCGQGDLNATNLSIYAGKCYPFDFDCNFQSIQSETSFAKTREAAFQSVDMEALDSVDEVILGGVSNLANSVNSVIPDVGEPFSEVVRQPAHMAQIRNGFKEQLKKLDNIPGDAIDSVLDKHLDDEVMRAQYADYLVEKKQVTHSMMETKTPSFQEVKSEMQAIREDSQNAEKANDPSNEQEDVNRHNPS